LKEKNAVPEKGVFQAPTPDDFIYHWTEADLQGALFGSLSGVGYTATMFLKQCEDAGFEMGASAFMIYHWLSNPGFTNTEYFFGPIADYFQIIVSIIYMYACISKEYLDESFIMVNGAKLVQASILPYVIYVTFK
jgi:hypothetical protein